MATLKELRLESDLKETKKKLDAVVKELIMVSTRNRTNKHYMVTGGFLLHLLFRHHIIKGYETTDDGRIIIHE